MMQIQVHTCTTRVDLDTYLGYIYTVYKGWYTQMCFR